MPYTKSNAPDIIKGLPARAKTIWIGAYNGALASSRGDEAVATKTAWSSVKKAGYRQDRTGKWALRANVKEDAALRPLLKYMNVRSKQRSR